MAWKTFCSTCSPNFHTKAATDIRASESKFKAHYHGGVVCPSCMCTACNSMYFVRAAAICTTSKKQKNVIQKAPTTFARVANIVMVTSYTTVQQHTFIPHYSEIRVCVCVDR